MRNRDATSTRLVEALKSYVPEAMRVTGAPGLNLALARGGEIIWQTGFGSANLANGLPMTSRTIARAGSMAKLYTATAVMQLVEQGRLDLGTPVNRYVKDLHVVNPLDRREVTLFDLMTFRSGLSADIGGATSDSPLPLPEYLRVSYEQPTLQEYGGTIPRWADKVGVSYQYSNLGVATLGYVVEVINPDRLSFSEYVRQHVMDILQMNSSAIPPVQSVPHVEHDMLDRVSTGYARFGSVNVPTPGVHSSAYPATALLTTPGDHLRLMLALQQGGGYDGQRILTEESVRQILTPHIPLVAGTSPGAGLWSGLVVRLHDIRGADHWFGHAGLHPWGWWNDSLVFPRRDFALVLCTNHVDMMRFHGAVREPLSILISEFISHWLERGAGSRDQGGSGSFAWRASYLSGVLLVERMRGLLGIEHPVTSETLDAMCVGAVPDRAGAGDLETWHAEGFRAGVKDTLGVGRTAGAFRSFLRSDTLSVPPEELRLLSLGLGGYGDIPVPAPIWDRATVLRTEE